jgi:outer membrane protein assembly factor BamB
MHAPVRPATHEVRGASVSRRTAGIAAALGLGAALAAALVTGSARPSTSGGASAGRPASASAIALAPKPVGPGEERLIVSHEDPAFDVAKSRLAMGRDGRVLLASDRYVMRMRRDGTDRQGGPVTYATAAAAANAAGVVATANAHFNHDVILWSAGFGGFEKRGAVGDFLVSDAETWQAPCDVESGESGDFYGLDQNRTRIVRLTSAARTVAMYALGALGGDVARKLPQFRVWERGRRFYVVGPSGTLHAVAFDGRELWSAPTPLRQGGGGWRGGFDVDERGRVLVLGDQEDAVQVIEEDGKSGSPLPWKLEGGKAHVSTMRVFDADVVVKGWDPNELFRVYDRATGALRRVVSADTEEFAGAIPDAWTAGTPVPLSIRRIDGRYAPPRRWRVWLRPFGAADFVELDLHDGAVTAPSDAGGLYQVRVTPAIAGSDSEYRFEKVVDIRRAGARGVVSVKTPDDRIAFGRGEPIPLDVTLRGGASGTTRVQLTLRTSSGVALARRDVEATAGAPVRVTIRPETTRALAPGRYEIVADAPGRTPVSQALVLGRGMDRRSSFSVVEYGDYDFTFPSGTVFDLPEHVARHRKEAAALGITMFVDRLGVPASMPFAQSLRVDAAAVRLTADPDGTPPDRASISGPRPQALAARGADGIEERAILLGMDASLPLGVGADRRTPAVLEETVRKATLDLAPYPAFRGWSWAANWWVSRLGADAAEDDAQKAAYVEALARARATGAWSPVLDAVSDHELSWAVDAEKRFSAAAKAVSPRILSAVTGPYRAVGVDPPVTFAHADEIDLHYQSEQIQPPEVGPHEVDFYKRPGKRAWAHPEIWNDDGTGQMILPELFQMIMRGADGVGWSGQPPWSGRSDPSDPRETGLGVRSVLRALGALARDYGPWLTRLRSADPVAIVVSSRMLRIDTWSKLGGEYFGRLYEAYVSCLYAHRPASFVFAEDVRPETLSAYRTVLVVGQRVEIEPALARALAAARSAGVPVRYDDTCLPSTVRGFEALGTAFDRVEHDPNIWQDDSAYTRVTAYFEEHAAALDRVFGRTLSPIVSADSGILASERTSGDGRFVWVVDDVIPRMDPGLAWRTSLLISSRVPLQTRVGLDAAGTVYDVFARRRVAAEGRVVEADLRDLPARLFAVLPRPIAKVDLDVPGQVVAGQSLPWRVVVRDDRGAPVPAALPVRVQLLAADGSTLEEQAAATSPNGDARDRWTVPVESSGHVVVRAVDLVAGIEVRASVAVSPVPLPFDLGGVPPGNGVPSRTQEQEGTAASADAPIERRFGPHLRDVALAPDGRTAVFGAMNWDDNAYAIDIATGDVAWRQRVGDHFGYRPSSTARGFAVEGFDRTTAEGYHLYLLGPDGRARRRFALYGLPKRPTSWARGSQLVERIDEFAVSPGGDWVASAGNLGLAVWDADGKRLWQRDEWKSERRELLLAAAGADTLIAAQGSTVTAYDAVGGSSRWEVRVPGGGHVRGLTVDTSGSVIAVRTDGSGGRVILIRAGQVVVTIPAAADGVALGPNGRAVALTRSSRLAWYDADGALLWTFEGDSVLGLPRLDAAGERVAVGTELGTLDVIDRDGSLRVERDLGAMPVTAWLAGGDLLAGTWMGDVVRLDGAFRERWRTHLAAAETDVRGKLLVADPTPTARVASWGNAAPGEAPLRPNLLAVTPALVTFKLDDHPVPFEQPIAALFDGRPDSPPKPWLPWPSINSIDSGWFGPASIEVDAFRSELRVTGVTFVEDPAHPESWLRDMRMQSWDPAREVWRDGPVFLSDAATHRHRVDPPLEAARFRFVTTGGGAWPAGNVRLGELVFEGGVLGCSHADAVAGRPVAVLFDDRESDLAAMLRAPERPFEMARDDAFSGGLAIALRSPGTSVPAFQPPFGHALPNWDFPIAEHPTPGQYRWLQFAWKALPGTTGMSLWVGDAWPGAGYAIVAGDPGPRPGAVATWKDPSAPPADWAKVRVDLWSLYHAKAIPIRALELAAVGGGALFDQILLARTEADLDRVPRTRP